jgi:DNA polymerase-3 subunit delta'
MLLSDEYLYIMEDAKVHSYNKIEEIIQGFEKAKIRLRANVNFEVVLELMLLNIKE